MSNGSTAILFFSRTQHDEFSAKPLGIKRSCFGSLYKFFTNRTLSTAKNTGLPLIESYSDQQKGRTFSERLLNELQLVANKGFEKVIIIGNDTPNLSSEDILLAQDQLSQGKHVLGKDKRGGTYLIGLNLSEFDYSLFNRVKWHSNAVHDQLLEQLDSVYELTAKTDINHLADIRGLFNEPTILTRGVIAFLLTFLGRINHPNVDFSATSISVIQLPAYRGPPSVSY